MSILFARKAAVPLWVIVFALVVLFSPQAGVAPGMLLLVGGGLVVPAILAVLFNGIHHRTPTEVSRPVEASPAVTGRPPEGIGRQRWSSRF
jgi:hypothetical protein